MQLEQLLTLFPLLTNSSPFLFAVLDANHRYLAANNRYSEISGLTHEELKGKNDADVFGQAFYDKLRPHYIQALSGNEVEAEIQLTDGFHESSFHFSACPLKLDPASDTVDGVIFHAADTSERQVLLHAMEEVQEKFDKLTELMDEGFCVTDNGQILTANDRAVTLLGFDAINEILSNELGELVVSMKGKSDVGKQLDALPDGHWLECKTGPRSTVERNLVVTQSAIHLLSSQVYLVVIREKQVVTEGEKHDNAYQKLAHFDPLTGLYNRHGFTRRLEEYVEAGTPLVMLHLDVDNFKNINDSLGHHIGDKVLQEIASRLRRMLPESAILGHLGGDEFAILLPEIAHQEEGLRMAEQVKALIKQPFDLLHFSKYLVCSIGMVQYPGDGDNARSLLQNVDTAMYEAKEQGRNRIACFHNQMTKEARKRLWLEIELQKALQNNGLEVWFQPKVSARDFTINGAEALVRWKHPIEGYINPGEFIPVAERSGLIEQLGRVIMRDVFQCVRRWQVQKLLPGRVAINLSPQQFRNPNLIEHIQQLQKVTSVDPRAITFELTESAVMSDGDHAIQMLKAIKKMGFALSIDDFGTGYSSFPTWPVSH